MVVGILMLSGMLFFMPLTFSVMNPYDEGNILCGAMRVFRGELPYQSFWSCYAPGQFYALAGLFSVFGESAPVLRLFDIFIRSSIAACCFILVRPFLSFALSLICYLAISVWLLTYALPGAPVYPATLFSLLSLMFVMRREGNKPLVLTAVGGLVAGIATLFRHDMGLLMVSGMTAALILFAFRSVSDSDIKRGRYSEAVVFALSAAIPVVLGLGYLTYHAGLATVFDQLVVFPLRTFADYRALPYPELTSALPGKTVYYIRRYLIYRTSFFIFPIGIVAGFVVSVFLSVRHQELQNRDRLIILLSVVGMAFVPQVLVRSDFVHLFPMAVFSTMIMYLVFSACLTRFRIRAAFVLVLCTVYLFLPYRDYGLRISGDMSPLSSDVEEIVSLLEKKAGAGAIYVGVENHDRMSTNEPAIYFLMGGRFGTRYHELHPGVVTTRQVQEEIIQNLVTNRVKTVVLSKGFREEPNASQYDHRLDLLDRYIENSYVLVANLSKYSLWETPGGAGETSAASGTSR